MAKKKNKKTPVVPCLDANQHVRERQKRKEKLAEWNKRKLEELRKMYQEEAKRRESLQVNVAPTSNPKTTKDVANE